MARTLAGLVIATGCGVLFGWCFNVVVLKSIFPGLVVMNPLTAVTFIVSGAAVFLLCAQSSARVLFMRRVCACFIFTVGVLKVFSYQWGIAIPVDRILFASQLGNNQIAPNTALNFFLLGSILFIVDSKQKFSLRIVQAVNLILLLVAWSALVGYVQNVVALYRVAEAVPMAIHTATAFVLIGFAVLLSRPERYFPVVLSLSVGTLIAFLIFMVSSRIEDDRIMSQLELTAKSRTTAFQMQINFTMDALHSLGSFYASSQNVERNEFKQFVSPIFERHGTIQALEWRPRVMAQDRQTFEQAVRVEGFPDFEIKERDSDGNVIRALDRPEYFPVVYVEPFEANKLAFSVDYSWSQPQLAAMSAARSSGQAVATNNLQLFRLGEHLERSSSHMGVFVLLPVYDTNMSLSSGGERQAHLKGFLSALFLPGQIFEVSLHQYPLTGLDVDIYDMHSGNADRLIYHYYSRVTKAGSKPVDKFQVRTAVDVAGRQWALVFKAHPFFIDGHRKFEPLAVFFVVFAFSLCVAWYLLNHIRETERRLADDKAKEIMRVKGEFISMVSHELRTPLTVIKGGIDVVIDEVVGPINEEQKDFLLTVKRNIDRLARLINNVLDYQKLEAGRMEFFMKPVDINGIVRDTVIDYEGVAKKKGLTLLGEYTNEPATAMVDRDKIIQVIINLLYNAIKFTKEGKTITIKSQVKEGSVRIAVVDQGIGIREEDLSKLFQSFSQVETAEERKTGGTGLGLSIAKKILERHNGRIEVSSVYGEGTTFTIVLPLHKESAHG